MLVCVTSVFSWGHMFPVLIVCTLWQSEPDVSDGPGRTPAGAWGAAAQRRVQDAADRFVLQCKSRIQIPDPVFTIAQFVGFLSKSECR
jgi:hypothetical protein